VLRVATISAAEMSEQLGRRKATNIPDAASLSNISMLLAPNEPVVVLLAVLRARIPRGGRSLSGSHLALPRRTSTSGGKGAKEGKRVRSWTATAEAAVSALTFNQRAPCGSVFDRQERRTLVISHWIAESGSAVERRTSTKRPGGGCRLGVGNRRQAARDAASLAHGHGRRAGRTGGNAGHDRSAYGCRTGRCLRISSSPRRGWLGAVGVSRWPWRVDASGHRPDRHASDCLHALPIRRDCWSTLNRAGGASRPHGADTETSLRSCHSPRAECSASRCDGAAVGCGEAPVHGPQRR